VSTLLQPTLNPVSFVFASVDAGHPFILDVDAAIAEVTDCASWVAYEEPIHNVGHGMFTAIP